VGADILKVGQGKAFAKKWIRKDPSDSSKLMREPAVTSIKDDTSEDLRQIREKGDVDGGSQEGEKKLKELRSRKLVLPRCVKTRQPTLM
jgi:hypothetical protein